MVLDTLPKLKLDKIKINKDRTFSAIILDKKEPNGKPFKILGREAEYWVKFACGNIPTKVLAYDGVSNILDFVKKEISLDYDYTFVLLSTTVLLEERDINLLKDYAVYKDIKLCKLPTGYIICNKYFLEAKSPQVDSIYTNEIDNFYIVENKKQLKYAIEVLQDRINAFHINNGVEIVKPGAVYIEPEVDIDGGVIIYPNVSLIGETKIFEGSIIKDGASISSSTIGKSSYVGKSVIENSAIGNNVCIASFCEINKSKIGNDVTIDSNCSINKAKIKAKEKIKSGSIINNDSGSRVR